MKLGKISPLSPKIKENRRQVASFQRIRKSLPS